MPDDNHPSPLSMESTVRLWLAERRGDAAARRRLDLVRLGTPLEPEALETLFHLGDPTAPRCMCALALALRHLYPPVSTLGAQHEEVLRRLVNLARWGSQEAKAALMELLEPSTSTPAVAGALAIYKPSAKRTLLRQTLRDPQWLAQLAILSTRCDRGARLVQGILERGAADPDVVGGLIAGDLPEAWSQIHGPAEMEQRAAILRVALSACWSVATLRRLYGVGGEAGDDAVDRRVLSLSQTKAAPRSALQAEVQAAQALVHERVDPIIKSRIRRTLPYWHGWSQQDWAEVEQESYLHLLKYVSGKPDEVRTLRALASHIARIRALYAINRRRSGADALKSLLGSAEHWPSTQEGPDGPVMRSRLTRGLAERMLPDLSPACEAIVRAVVYQDPDAQATVAEMPRASYKVQVCTVRSHAAVLELVDLCTEAQDLIPALLQLVTAHAPQDVESLNALISNGWAIRVTSTQLHMAERSIRELRSRWLHVGAEALARAALGRRDPGAVRRIQARLPDGDGDLFLAWVAAGLPPLLLACPARQREENERLVRGVVGRLGRDRLLSVASMAAADLLRQR